MSGNGNGRYPPMAATGPTSVAAITGRAYQPELAGYPVGARVRARQLARQALPRRPALAVLMVIAAPMQAGAQGTDDLDALNKQVVTLYGEGKYAEATEIAKRSLVLAERKFGPDHPSVGTGLNNLAEPRRLSTAPGEQIFSVGNFRS